ncbi:MAG: alginate lyase family protein [Terriglobales bacterium]
MSLAWTIARLRAMSTPEIAYRGTQYLRTQWQRAGFGGAATTPTADAGRGLGWLETVPLGFAVETYRTAAERILGGSFRLFGQRDWALGFPPAWNRDPQTGTDAPIEFGKTLNYRDSSIVGNIKCLWEPNRHLELVTLAQAWRLTGEARFAHGCRSLLDSWIIDCPYLKGPNWTSSLELALRLVNWSCTWHLLGGDAAVLFDAPDGPAFKARWLHAVRQHCHFIAGYLSRYSSGNNHLLGELLGLLLAATTWPCWPESERWRTQARKQFEEQALVQNSSDGVNREHAIWYQHEVADMMLLAGLTMQRNGCGFGPGFWNRLEAMLSFMASCMDAAGNVPALGDSDDAVIVRFCPAPLCVYRSLLATGSVLFARSDFKHKARVFDDKSRWLLGDAAAEKFAEMPADASGQNVRRAFPEGGYYILGGEFETAHEVRMVVDAAPLGYLAIAAHGHADALSFVLSAGGCPMLVDPGTYSYHTERAWRDYFRGTSAHNTVRIDGADQSVSAGSFLWTQHADAACVELELEAERERIVCKHGGYRRLPDPVEHWREIVYERAATLVTVTDSIVCKASHRVELFWHFAEECALTLSNDSVVAARGAIALTLQWPTGLSADLVRGRDSPCLGWLSRHLGHKTPSYSLVVAGEVPANWRGVTRLGISWGRP